MAGPDTPKEMALFSTKNIAIKIWFQTNINEMESIW